MTRLELLWPANRRVFAWENGFHSQSRRFRYNSEIQSNRHGNRSTAPDLSSRPKHSGHQTAGRPRETKAFPHRRANRNPSKLEYRQSDQGNLTTNSRRSAIVAWRSCGGCHCRWCHHCRRHNSRDALLPELILSKLIWRVVGTQHKTLTGRYRLIDSRSNRPVGCRWIIGSLAASLGRTGLLWRATATVIGNPSRLHTSVVSNPRCIEHTPDQIVVGFSLPNT